MGLRTKRSDDGPAVYGGPISFAARARPLRSSPSREGQLVEIGVGVGQHFYGETRYRISTTLSTSRDLCPLRKVLGQLAEFMDPLSQRDQLAEIALLPSVN
jgi:hypothetical protein